MENPVHPKEVVVYFCHRCYMKTPAPRGEQIVCVNCGVRMEEKAEIMGKFDGTPWRREEFRE